MTFVLRVEEGSLPYLLSGSEVVGASGGKVGPSVRGETGALCFELLRPTGADWSSFLSVDVLGVLCVEERVQTVSG